MMFFPGEEDYDDYDYEGYEDHYFDYDSYDDDVDFSYEDSEYDMESCFPERNHKMHCAKLLEGLNRDRLSGEMCDGIICVDGRDFPIHRVVLASASSYFRAMFAGSFFESKEKRTEIKDIGKEAFGVVLGYIYGENNKLSEENLSDVYDCADMLCVDSVVKECKDFLRYKCLMMKDKLVAYFLAKRMELAETAICLTSYFHREFEKIVKEPYFLEMPYEVLRELIGQKLAGPCVIDVAVQAVVDWVTHTPDNRFVMAEKLLSDIHLDQLTNTKMEELVSALAQLNFDDKTIATLRDEVIEKLRNNLQVVRQKVSDLRLNVRYVVASGQTVEIAQFSHETWDWAKHNPCLSLGTKVWEGFNFNIECIQEAVAVGDELFMFGTFTVLAYNLASKTCRSLPQLPNPRTNFSVAVNGEDTIFVIGGDVRDILQYNPVSNTWVKVSAWHDPRSKIGVVVSGDLIYMLGGLNAKTTSTSDYFISYNMWSGKFKRMPKLIRGVHEPLVALYKNKLFVFDQSTVDSYVPFLGPVKKDMALCQIFNIFKKKWSDSKLTILACDRILGVKAVATGILVVLWRKDGDNFKVSLSTYNPEEDSLNYIALLPPTGLSILMNGLFCFSDVC